MPVMKTSVNVSVIKIRKGPLNFNSRAFKKALRQAQKRNEQIDKYRKIDTQAMLDRYVI